jgi:hypothetical protein
MNMNERHQDCHLQWRGAPATQQVMVVIEDNNDEDNNIWFYCRCLETV